MKNRIPALLTALVAMLSAPAYAAGALQVTGDGGTVVEMPLQHTRVAIEVSAFLARATIEQTFSNPFETPVEAVYTFPLGDRAAVDDFELAVGDRVIRGVIRRREEARAIYEEARATGYQAAILEQERPNIFTQSVANLEPGKEIRVRIRTVETLRYERGTYQLTFPLVVGPRYIPGGGAGPGGVATTAATPTPRVPDASRITPPVLKPGFRSRHDVDIEVTLAAGVPIGELSSPSHRIVADRRAGNAARVKLAPGDAIPNKDFILRWSVSSERPAVGLLAHRDGLDGFFALLVQPKGQIDAAEAAPKEITFVLDTSGSMSGIPIEASKRFLSRALRELGPRDTFNLVRFAGDNEVYAKVPQPNSSVAVERAIAWISRQQGAGGTELLAAMRAAFARPADPDRLRVVVFLTDGYVGNDDEILGAIGPVLGDARIYTVGIGSSVNHYILDRMADLGNGAYVFVRPDESADAALTAFRDWVTKPYLTDLTVDWGALPVADVSPERIRDLGSGQTLRLVGRYLYASEGEVVVRGKLGGRYWEQRFRAALPERAAAHEALGSLWARGRIEELLSLSPGAPTDSIRAEVTSLALSYRLMSPYTSFVAVDDSRVVNPGGESRAVHQALPVPDGVSFEGVFGADGPAALRVVKAGENAEDESDRTEDARETTFGRAMGGVVGGGVPGGVAYAPAPPPSRSEAKLSLKRGMQAVAELVMPLRMAEPPPTRAASGRGYQNTIRLAPGLQDPDGDGNPNVAGARDREFKMIVGGVNPDTIESVEVVTDGASTLDAGVSARLLDAAFRVLADLADDGELAPSEGRPALAALLAAQRPSGAISESVVVHAVAAWALAEARAKLPSDRWIQSAATKAVDHLVSLRSASGWPARPGGDVDADATRWSRFVLGIVRPSSVSTVPAPTGEPSPAFARLSGAIAGKAAGSPAPGSRSAFERLVASMGRGNLKARIR